MDIIIYGTQYGTAKKYAMELSRRTEISCMSYEEIDDINKWQKDNRCRILDCGEISIIGECKVI